MSETARLGYRPVERLLIAYLTVTGVAILASLLRAERPISPGGALLLIAARAAAVALLAWRARVRPRPGRFAGRFLLDVYPPAALALAYHELSILTRLLSSGLHDSAVADWEARLFGFQPSQTLRGPHHPALVDEYLHFCYFAYYFVPASLVIWSAVRREWELVSQALTATIGAFLACAVVFILFPVAGPYHHFGHPSLADLGGLFPRLAHAIVQNGSSIGTAFPSSHTAVAVAVWLTAWRTGRPIFWALAAVVPGLAAGTVYGGFHYAVDTLAGAAIGVIAALSAPRFHPAARRSPRSPGSRSAS